MTDAELKTKIAVLVLDDSAVMRRILATVLEKDPEINVIGFARNGLEAIEAVARLKPQVVTLDIEMPKLDGI
ncbi:MAG: response regulator, partial [Comamonadaceae bacterium]